MRVNRTRTCIHKHTPVMDVVAQLHHQSINTSSGVLAVTNFIMSVKRMVCGGIPKWKRVGVRAVVKHSLVAQTERVQVIGEHLQHIGGGRDNCSSFHRQVSERVSAFFFFLNPNCFVYPKFMRIGRELERAPAESCGIM